MSKTYDLIVVGLGAHGSAILYHAARLGLSVLGVERFDIGHGMGSSHGVHRLFRLAYAEGPQYVPMLKRAAELWDELQHRSGETIFVRKGLVLGSPGGQDHVAAAKANAEAHDVACEVMSASEINNRFPAFDLADDMIGLYQPDSGFVMSERAIAAHLIEAMALGADVRSSTVVSQIEDLGHGVRVKAGAATFEGGQVAVASGAWTGQLFPDLAALHQVERRVLGFFAPRRPVDFAPDTCPAYSFKNDQVGIYGFPIAGFPGVKIGRSGHLGETGDPDTLPRETNARDEEALRAGLRAFLRDADGPALAFHGCLITETRDHQFILDQAPGTKNVHVVSACSGHGFKFASVIGEIIARRAAGNADEFDLSFFRLSRFGPELSA